MIVLYGAFLCRSAWQYLEAVQWEVYLQAWRCVTEAMAVLWILCKFTCFRLLVSLSPSYLAFVLMVPLWSASFISFPFSPPQTHLFTSSFTLLTFLLLFPFQHFIHLNIKKTCICTHLQVHVHLTNAFHMRLHWVTLTFYLGCLTIWPYNLPQFLTQYCLRWAIQGHLFC